MHPDDLNKAFIRNELDHAIQEAIDSIPVNDDLNVPVISVGEYEATRTNEQEAYKRALTVQLADPKWREKVELLHSSYYVARNGTGYYTPETHKIIAFTQPFAPGKPLAVGSTKDTIAKYWVGVGVLKPQDGSFRQLVLSPSQLRNAKFDWEAALLPGLSGKNFSKVRVIKTQLNNALLRL